MKAKKIFVSAAAVLLVLLTLLTACAPAGEPEVTTEEATEADTLPESSDIVLIDENEEDYMIIRPMNAGTYEVEGAKNINMTLREVFPTWDMKIADDFVKGAARDEAIENNDKEILVGETNRKESREVLASLAEGDYVIRFVGNKLVILGCDQYATNCAAEYFINTYIKNAADKTRLVLPRDLCITGHADQRKIPLDSDSTYRYLSWNLGCSVGIAADCVNVIMRYLPDIICLQESDKKIHNNVISTVINSFKDYKYVAMTHKNSSTYCYTPIIYNSRLFTLLDSGVEWLDGRYTGTNTKCLCWAVFKDNDGKTFGMINFHGAVCSNNYKGYENYSSDQLNEVASKWRIDNVRQIIDVKNSIIQKYGNITVTVGGDCNFKEGSQPYLNLKADGFLDAEKTARGKITTGYTTSFSYGNFYKSGQSIDHIFQNGGGVDFVVFEIVRDADVKTGSDHCPIYVDFNLK